MRYRHLPAFSLELIQTLVGEGKYRITSGAFDGAASLYLGEDDIVACVLGLRRSDYDQTLDSTAVPGTKQDVYLPRFHGFAIYLKLRLVESTRVVVISFKRNTSA